MAYATTADAGFRISALKHGSTTLNGGLQSTMEKIVEREVLQAEEENTPVSRPVDRVDARTVFAVLDGSSMIAESTAAANCITEFKAADAGSGSVTHGPMVANGYVPTMGRNQGGFRFEQEFVMEGTSLTETLTF